MAFGYQVLGFGSGGVAAPQDPYDIEVLCVGAGASGGYNHAGAGGAGGYRTDATLELTGGTDYTITVGAGGAARTSQSVGADGGDSILSGTGITTLTSGGGGGGGTGDTQVPGRAGRAVNGNGGGGG